MFTYSHISTQSLSHSLCSFLSSTPIFPPILQLFQNPFSSPGITSSMSHIFIPLFFLGAFPLPFPSIPLLPFTHRCGFENSSAREGGKEREADPGFSRHFLAGFTRERPQKLPAPTLKGFIPWGFDPAGSSLRQPKPVVELSLPKFRPTWD